MSKSQLIYEAVRNLIYAGLVIFLSYRVYRLNKRLNELGGILMDFIKFNNARAYNAAKLFVDTHEGKPNLSDYEVAQLESAKLVIKAAESLDATPPAN